MNQFLDLITQLADLNPAICRALPVKAPGYFAVGIGREPVEIDSTQPSNFDLMCGGEAIKQDIVRRGWGVLIRTNRDDSSWTVRINARGYKFRHPLKQDSLFSHQLKECEGTGEHDAIALLDAYCRCLKYLEQAQKEENWHE